MSAYLYRFRPLYLVFFFLLFQLTACSESQTAPSDEGGWKLSNNGLPANVLSLAIARDNSQIIYASASGGGIFKSSDGGTSWLLINSLPCSQISSIAINPFNNQILYAGTDTGIYKSVDGGVSWNAASSGLINVTNLNTESQPIRISDVASGNVKAIVIDPINSQILYAGCNGGLGLMSLGTTGLYKSVNGGHSWMSLTSGIPAETGITSLALDQNNPHVIYAGTETAGVYKSNDGGNSWSLLQTGISNSAVTSLLIDPNNSNVVYTSTTSSFTGLLNPTVKGILKSVDGGTTWNTINSGLPDSIDVQCLTSDSNVSLTLYAGTSSGVYKSIDNGASWYAVNSGMPHNAFVATISVAANSHTLLATVNEYANDLLLTSGTGSNVFKSIDGAASWNKSSNGLYGSYVSKLIVTPDNSQILYLMTGNGVYKSVNATVSWTKAGSSGGYTALVLAPNSLTTLYAALFFAGMNKTTDGGTTWNSFNAPPVVMVSDIVIDPNNSSVMYVGGYDSGIYKTVDQGQTWSLATNGLPSNVYISKLAINPINSQIIYAGSFVTTTLFGPYVGGMYKSVDGGSSWSSINTGLPEDASIYTITVAPQSPQTIYVSNQAGVFKSIDSGMTWSAINSGLPENTQVSDIAIAPQNNQTLYAATYSGVFKSINGGIQWRATNKNLLNKYVTALAIDPLDSDIVYAGTTGGIYKTTTGGM